VYGGYDNSGTAALGFDRWNLGANWGNAFGLDQQISYQFTASSDFFQHLGGSGAGLTAHSLNWLIPLPWRDKLAVFGNYSESRPRVGPDLGLTGVAGQASFRYIANLPAVELSFLGPGVLANHDLQAGFDYKTTNNDLSFGGEEVSNVTAEVDQFPVTYDLGFETLLGQTALSNTIVWSPGGLTGQNKDIFFRQQANNPYAAAKYIYDTLNLTQTVRLPLDLSWVTRVQAQIADHNLLPSEQLGAGGATSVRGYHERTASGSEGVLLSEEIRSPVFAPLARFLPAELADSLQLLAFWDYASVREVHLVQGLPASIQLSGVGGGLRYVLSRFVDVRLDYGHELLKAPGAAKLDNVLHVSITIGN
jgi:hemolysin activation/secretion protein